MDIAQQIEFVSQIYYQARVAGKPVLLSDENLNVVLGTFQKYRQK